MMDIPGGLSLGSAVREEKKTRKETVSKNLNDEKKAAPELGRLY
jgi:hypothetical protein